MHRQTVEIQRTIRLVLAVRDLNTVEGDAGLHETGDLVVRQTAERKEPFLPINGFQKDGLFFFLSGHAEQNMHTDAWCRNIRYPRPVVAVHPAADHIVVRGNRNRLRRTDDHFRQAFSVIAIRQFADVFSEQLLFAGPFEFRDGVFRLDGPSVQIFEINQRWPVVFCPAGPIHFIWSHADRFFLSNRGNSSRHAHDERQQT